MPRKVSNVDPTQSVGPAVSLVSHRRTWGPAGWPLAEDSARSTMSDGQDGDRRSSRASSSTGSSSSFSPSISGFYGADAETAKHVVMLVNDVRQVGGDHVYKPFIRLLKDCAAGRFAPIGTHSIE